MSERGGMLGGMGRIKASDRALADLLRRQCDLVTRSQALAGGMTEGALRSRLCSGGPWRVVLPGIYLSHNGLLTVGQRELAAALYAGHGCVITGAAALTRHGVRAPISEVVDVLIPHDERRQSKGFVRVHRTIRMPERPWLVDNLRWAPPARAVADAVSGNSDMRSVSALVADAVQQRKCTVQQLAGELAAGPKQGSAALRAALTEVMDGVASVAEGDLRKLIKRSGLPEPLYNPRLYVGSNFLAEPDAWWHEAGVAGEVDSREWHLSPSGWERTLARHARMSAQGIIVLHFTPRQIRSDSATVVAELRSAIDAGRGRPSLPIRAVPTR